MPLPRPRMSLSASCKSSKRSSAGILRRGWRDLHLLFARRMGRRWGLRRERVSWHLWSWQLAWDFRSISLSAACNTPCITCFVGIVSPPVTTPHTMMYMVNHEEIFAVLQVLSVAVGSDNRLTASIRCWWLAASCYKLVLTRFEMGVIFLVSLCTCPLFQRPWSSDSDYQHRWVSHCCHED